MRTTQPADKQPRRFWVWAPEKKEMTLHIVVPFDKKLAMHKDDQGYFGVDVEGEGPFQYFFVLEDGKEHPDPASHFQPEGVHGPSETVDHALYSWNDSNWKGLALEEMIIYELHVGTFTSEGTFEAIIPRLHALKETGINTLELMPVAQFPGARNWGYDGAFPYAVQSTYGGPQGLKKLVDACHQRGMAVLLDVVYNHFGPEGAIQSKFGPYTTAMYCTPWGEAINYDGAWSDGVRDYFSDNAVFWMEHYHIDGLRCDAIHAVFDNGAVHFWEQTTQKVKALGQKLGKQFHLMAESDLNSPRVVHQPERGGYGFDAQWLDDFHHTLYVLLNPTDKERYYDFGKLSQLAKAYTDGFVHSGEWVQVRKRKHGASSKGIPGNRFVAFNLNHDQVGNRAGGERLSMLVNFERVKLAAAALFLSPYIPLLFMGEEYADDTPFFYFVSHSDKDLIKAVQEGRKAEFKDFGFDGEVPDPQDENSFLRSKIHWEKRTEGKHNLVLQWHKELINLRRTTTPLKNFSKEGLQVDLIGEDGFVLIREAPDTKEKLFCFFNLSDKKISYTVPANGGGTKLLDSEEVQWQPTGKGGESHPVRIQASDTFTLLPVSVVVYTTTAKKG